MTRVVEVRLLPGIEVTEVAQVVRFHRECLSRLSPAATITIGKKMKNSTELKSIVGPEQHVTRPPASSD
jgi:hypothetical protein